MHRLLAMLPFGVSASLGLAFTASVHAASLQVAPVSIDLTAPAQTAAVNLRNDSDRPINVQVRVFKWQQQAGEDQLIPTGDVIASPPAASLRPGATYTIRVGRRGGALKSGEEAYRLLIDELPDVNVRRPANTVNLTMRYSIPVFFADRRANADLRWEVISDAGKLLVRAINTGSRHAKIVNLTVAAASGQVNFGRGLNGYVLPGSTRQWVADSNSRRIGAGSHVTITAKGDDYAVNQAATVSGR